MRPARPFVAIPVSRATWCISAAAAAFAMLPLPPGGYTNGPGATSASGSSMHEGEPL